MKVCVVQPMPARVSETFLRDQAEKLPAEVSLIVGRKRPRFVDEPVSSLDRWTQSATRLVRRICRRPKSWEITRAHARLLRRARPDVVLAQYGPTGVWVMDACRKLGVSTDVELAHVALRYGLLDPARV